MKTKVRIYPKKADVVGQLLRERDCSESLLSEAQEKLDKLNSSGLYTGESPATYKRIIQERQEHLQSIQDRLNLLAGHDAPEVMAEFEL